MNFLQSLSFDLQYLFPKKHLDFIDILNDIKEQKEEEEKILLKEVAPRGKRTDATLSKSKLKKNVGLELNITEKKNPSRDTGKFDVIGRENEKPRIDATSQSSPTTIPEKKKPSQDTGKIDVKNRLHWYWMNLTN